MGMYLIKCKLAVLMGHPIKALEKHLCIDGDFHTENEIGHRRKTRMTFKTRTDAAFVMDSMDLDRDNFNFWIGYF